MAYTPSNTPRDFPEGPTACPEFDEARPEFDAAYRRHAEARARRVKIEEELRAADRDYPDRAAAADVAGEKRPTDPRPKLNERRQAAVQEEAIASRGVTLTADKLWSIARAKREEWRDAELARHAESMGLALGAVSAYILPELEKAKEARKALAFLQRRCVKAGTHPAEKTAQKLVDELEESVNPPPVVQLSPVAHRKVREGETVETLDGRKVTLADLEGCRVEIAHGRPRATRQALAEAGIGDE